MNVNDGQGGFITPSQEEGGDSSAVFNEQIPLVQEDEGLITGNSFETQDDPWAAPIQNDENQHQNNTDIDPDDFPANDDTPLDDEDIFADPLVSDLNTGNDENDEDESALIEKLKAKGYDINKAGEPVAPDQLQRNEYNRLDQEYNEAIKFINKSADEKILEKVKDDLAKEYRSLGRTDQIGGEDFEYEVNLKVEKISENPATKEMYADNIKKGVEAYATQLKEKQNKIVSDQEQQQKRETAERRLSLQSEMKPLIDKDFMGITLSQKMVQEAYQDITSGEFTKEVNENPKLVAEFALFKRNKEAIMANFGGATYGEGVKDGVKTLLSGNNGNTSRSPLQQALTQSANASGSKVSRRSAWQMPDVDNTEQTPIPAQAPPRPYVAGRGNN